MQQSVDDSCAPGRAQRASGPVETPANPTIAPSESRPASMSGWSAGTSVPSMLATTSATRVSMAAWAACVFAGGARPAAGCPLRASVRRVRGALVVATGGAKSLKTPGTCGRFASSLDHRMLAPISDASAAAVAPSTAWSTDMPTGPGRMEEAEAHSSRSAELVLASTERTHRGHAWPDGT